MEERIDYKKLYIKQWEVMMNNNVFKSIKLPSCKVVNKENVIINNCKGKKVLHLGCVDYPLIMEPVMKNNLLHTRIIEVAEKVLGIDISQKGIEFLNEKYGIDNIIHGDVEKLSELNIKPEFDVVVIGELLEHLANPGLLLHELEKICTQKTLIIITVPNAFSAKSFLRVMMKKELVHSDHVAYYSLRTIYSLTKKFDFEIISVNSYLSLSKKKIIRFIQILPHFLISHFVVYLADGLIIYLKKSELT